jgi:hypothetical protein
MRVTVGIVAASLLLVTHAWHPASAAAAQSSPAGQSDKSAMDKAADGTKTAAKATASGAKTAGSATVEGTKKAGEATAGGAKSVGKAITGNKDKDKPPNEP